MVPPPKESSRLSEGEATARRSRAVGEAGPWFIRPWLTKTYFRVLVVATVGALVLTAWLNREALSDPQRLIAVLGYPAVFLMALLSSGTVFLPLPGAAAVFLGGMALSPLLVGIVAGAGDALGEMVGYGVGYSGQGLVENKPLYKRMEASVLKRGGLAVFVGSLVPNPFFDVIGLAAGVLKYPAARFLLYTWAGKTIKCIGIAFAGHYGAEWVGRMVG